MTPAAHENATETQVLIVGAGPTGLALAVWLARLGVTFRIIDRNDGPAPFSRALGVHARTLEFYRQLGFAGAAIADGVIVPSINLWTRGRRVASVPFRNAGEGMTPYPFVLDFAQDRHERLLIDVLGASGIAVERRTELMGIEQDADSVTATIRTGSASTTRCRCRFVAGCDGAHSVVREVIGVTFAGGTYEHLFYVADVTARGPAVDQGVHVDLDESDLLAIFDMKGSHHVRLVGTVRGAELDANRDRLTFDDVSQRPITELHLEVDRVNWFSTYRVHHRVANRFRVGRAFLLGDAAHVHSPVGAQGMNTGIGDAVNLSWKLAAVLAGRAGSTILDSYEEERIAFARRLVATTDRAFEIASRSSRLAAVVRTKVFPTLVRVLFRAAAARRFLFRTVSQLSIHYRRSALSVGSTGTVRGGDRLPWVPADGVGSGDNYEALKTLDWQVHIYGTPTATVREACDKLGVPLHIFGWRSAAKKAGLVRNALYLVRPDGYLAIADAECRGTRLREYFTSRTLSMRQQ